MRTFQVVGIGVRLFAVFLGLITIRYAIGVVPAMADASLGLGLAMGALTIVLPLLIVLLLWFFPLSVAEKIVPRVKSEEELPAWTVDDFQAMGFSLIGLWLLATTLSDVFYWLVYVNLTLQIDHTGLSISPDQKASLVATAIDLVLAVFLLLGGRGLTGAIRRIRYAGT